MPKVERYNPNINEGLNNEQIDSRKNEGLVNYDTTVPTKSIKAIIISNLFTVFNLLNIALGIAVFFTGSYKNLLFLVIITCNTIISTYQEIHSKRVIDKLAVVSATKTTVIRNSKEEKIGINEIVLDDIIKLNVGNQIITDCIICDGEVEVNESFITGEPDSIYKKSGDLLLSGSFIVSGNCIAKVEHIAGDNYTAKIGHDAKQIKMAKSEIMISLNKIIKTVSFFIFPIGLILLYNQIKVMGASLDQAILQTVAALIGMIPEGLILLTSTVLAVSSIRLSKSKVLIQELYCIEALARVDTLCLDKTGTITEGRMEIKGIVPENFDKEKIEDILGELSIALEDINPTMEAIRQTYKKNAKLNAIGKVPFSSQRKWSAVFFEDEGSYILGAPEIVLGKEYEKYKSKLDEYSEECRVLVLAKSVEKLENKQLPCKITICGFVLLQDVIRKEAGDTLKYFKEQGVNIKIISGDNPITVASIAKRAGVENFDKYIDMRNIEQSEIKDIVKKYTIFGRVSPTQKQELVKAIKDNGHTVAMTGDGVNDVLALKEADCSIAIATGSDAARNVSQLVLLNSNFSSMPKIVAEGRRTINNIERSSELFLTKTIYASILAVLFAIITMPYPFKPIQFSLINVVTIGIPSFVLALQPNKARVKGKFLRNILSRALPTSLTVVCNIIFAGLFSYLLKFDDNTYATFCVILTTITGFTLLFKLCRPFNLLRGALLVFVITLFLMQIIFLRDIFYIAKLNEKQILILLALIAISESLYLFFNYIAKKIYKKKLLYLNNKGGKIMIMKKDKQKGITLVALVTTVVVVIILTGVAIGLAINHDGAINKSEKTVEQWNNKVSTEDERINDTWNMDYILKATTDRSNINVGDYVKYVPVEKPPYEAHLTSAYTGYDSNQSLSQEYNIWRVICKNTDGSIVLFPVKKLANSRTNIRFANAIGWNNAVYILHEMSDYLYSNEEKGITARSMTFSDIENLLIDGTKGDTFKNSTGKTKIVKYREEHVAELEDYGNITSKRGLTVTYSLKNKIHRQPKLFQYVSTKLEDKYYTAATFESSATSMGYKDIKTSTISYTESGAWNVGYKRTDFIDPKIYDIITWGQYGYLATRGLDTKWYGEVDFGLYHIDYNNYISCGSLFDSAYPDEVYGNLIPLVTLSGEVKIIIGEEAASEAGKPHETVVM